MSDLSTPLARAPRRLDSTNPKPLGIALVLVALGAVYLAQTVSARQATLYHAAFGFTSAFAGNVLGTKLRPLFGLVVDRVKNTGC